MVYETHVVQDQEIMYEGVLDFAKFLKRLRAWCKSNGYSVIYEDLYQEKENKGLKDLKIKWKVDKKPDDYHKFIIKFELMLKEYQEGHVDNKKVVKGNFVFKVKAADIEWDYDEKWRSAPWKVFWRGIVDKFVSSEKEDRLRGILREEVVDVQQVVKEYLGV